MPVALTLSAIAPWAIAPLLMVGGAYLCYEGFEKIAHQFLYSEAEDKAHDAEIFEVLTHPDVDMLVFEKDKIKGAIRTDFVLSGEIIIITLGTVASAPFMNQVAVLSAIAIIMTIGVYGFVGLIVPHIIRSFAGERPSAILIPSALGGAALMLIADSAVRLIPGSGEVRLGIAMAVIGAPFFFALLARMQARAS